MMLPGNGVSTTPEPVALVTKWAVLGSNSWYTKSTLPSGFLMGGPNPPTVAPGPNGLSTLPGFGWPFARVGRKFASPPPELPSAEGADGVPQAVLLPAVHCGSAAVAIRFVVLVLWRN